MLEMTGKLLNSFYAGTYNSNTGIIISTFHD